MGDDSDRQVTHPVLQTHGQLNEEPDFFAPRDKTFEENDFKEGFLGVTVLRGQTPQLASSCSVIRQNVMAERHGTTAKMQKNNQRGLGTRL